MLILLSFWEVLLRSMLTRHALLLLAAGAAMATVASPAHAITLTQDTIPVAFSTNGNQTSAAPNTTAINFQPFTASTSDTLTGVTLKFVPSPVFTGNASLVNFATGPSTITYAGTAAPSFTFSGIGGSSTGTASAFTLSQTSVTNPVLTVATIVVATIGGNYGGTVSALSAATVPLQNYFSTAPSISSYYANWIITGTPTTGAAGNVTPAFFTPGTLDGQVYLSYQYTAPDPINPVPGPLPILGAGAAFGFSRKLRQRIRSSAS